MYLEHFNSFLYGWIILAIVVLPMAVRFVAPYGRHTTKNWGLLMDNKWGWIIMELPALLVLPVFIYIGENELNWPMGIMVGLFVLHYINRVIIYPNRIKTKGKMIPLSIVAMALVFNLVNGSILGIHFAFGAEYMDSWMSDPRFILGFILFVAGAYINLRSDHMLINLRKPGETHYKIPRGFLFNRVSCPNHLGEIIEWVGFGIMTWSMPGLSFAVWTAANLIPRTLNHHRWYKEKFHDYPEDRKAVIPSVL